MRKRRSRSAGQGEEKEVGFEGRADEEMASPREGRACQGDDGMGAPKLSWRDRRKVQPAQACEPQVLYSGM